MSEHDKELEFLQPNELNEEQKASMKTRIISAIVGVIVAVPLIVMGDFFFFAFIAFLLFASTWEIIHCAKKKYNIALDIVAFILAIAMTYWPIIMSIPGYIDGSIQFGWHIYTAFEKMYISVLVFAVSAIGVFSMVLIDKGFTVRDACFIFTMMVLICVGYQAGLYLRYIPSIIHHANYGVPSTYFNLYDNLESSLLIVYVLVATFLTDGGAYFVGVFFGKHKMLERVSPKKTWEGFFGGVIISSLLSFVFAFLFALFGHPLLIGVLDLEHWYLILILSLLIPLASVLGDFVFSSAKRFFDIKDFGNIMPGHGGALDRLDSVIFTLTTTAVFISACLYFMSLIK